MSDVPPAASPSSVDRPLATLKQQPEDFVVDEIPAYLPNGEGEHLYLHFRKTGHNTLAAIRLLAAALEVDAKQVGYAGMKDRHAITTQWASFPFPMARDEADAARIAIDGIEIVAAQRHKNKLKTGHLVGNRFRITLRDIAPEATARVRDALLEVGQRGVPNAFGEQRFGRERDNAARALAWLRGEARPPRGKKEQRFYVSALQSEMFNAVLAIRDEHNTWDQVMLGDLAQKHDSGGVFLVDEAALPDARERAVEGLISATGPMFGAKMTWPEGAPEAIERQILESTVGSLAVFDKVSRIAQGARRALRLMVSEMSVSEGESPGVLHASFVLPKGGYATTVLARACTLRQA